ncbi:MAG: valine--tRNA ligase [Candidatus Kerfeldbacteria bacterium CG08_land_8_20_14_0_20_42_7]|uniref:Valine--tRNA ligase n=1 Tax=Candidatus Kerfeldbacteria bacterium CG08_land_8_20_14_0_20_42_7 TaxID=2014245 RepID=A0A2H0YTF1_9BACT|nr:MAG: valine--tRNA ligase [Candidatus Kerfeldbacteria bacterium CG08_land_8_20_14_0_20_42_7]
MSEKAYNPSLVEKEVYERWEKSGYFNPDKLPGKRTRPFVVSMPPPNVTGELHLGHASRTATQDTLIRYHRMRGFRALWVPGTDHAGIATQIVVERLIMKQGLDRHKLGREKFLQRVWEWKKQYGASITNQIRSLGASCDWSREAFTMDKERSLAVRTAFKQLYDDGLIYRGKRIISWCPRCSSAISDLEVKHVETTGKLYTIRYPLVGTTKYISVATTRPETMLGDTAIAVHPHDPRYKKFIGKKVTVPLIEREIAIIADDAVEKDFGTGAVKVTPAHDPLDFEIGERHTLPHIQVIDEGGKMTKEAGIFYSMSVQDARRMALEHLEKDGHLESVVDYVHNVAHCDRCGTVIEPLISEQWFMSMKSLAQDALKIVRQKKIEIVPTRFTKIYTHWMTNLHDWTLSRQLWWGHQIPVWYCDACGTDHPIVEISTPTKCPRCKGKHIHQDPDTLDTWFSSGLWTFSTLGWPRKTKDLKLYHPTQVMETAWDILPFWISRMIMLSLKLTKQVPFSRVLISGLVLNKDGEKMSKSKGTGIDPLPMARKYGTDAIRLSVTMNTSPGQDFRLSEEKIAHYRNFINKIWNIGKFVQSQSAAKISSKPKTLTDAWILSRLRYTTKEVDRHLAALSISDAGLAVYQFLWHEFADWYIEIAKAEKNVEFTKYIFMEGLKLLHPFAPFVSEELWKKILGKQKKSDLLMIQKWPTTTRQNKKAEKEFATVQNIVTGIRTIRNITRTPHTTKLHIRMSSKKTKFIDEHGAIIKNLTNTETCTACSPKDLRPTLTFPGLILDLQLGAEAQTLLHAEVARLQKDVARLSSLLANAGFKKNAPLSVIKENTEKLQNAEEALKHLHGA